MRLLIVDDDPMIRHLLCDVLTREPDITCVGTCSNGLEAVQHPALADLDIILMDIQMPVMDGIEATRQIRASHPSIKIVAWTAFEYDEAVTQAINEGAAGFILKNAPIDALVDTLRAIHRGLRVLSDKPFAALHSHPHQQTGSQLPALTDRERHLLTGLCQGRTNTELAQELYLSASSIKQDLTALMAKFGVHNRVALTVAALAAGFTPTPPANPPHLTGR